MTNDPQETKNQRGEDGQEIALEPRAKAGTKLYSPSVARNKTPILEIFRQTMPEDAKVLEVASGTGEHGAYLTTHLPQLAWQPSDPDPVSRASFAAWAETIGGGRMAPPLNLSTMTGRWWGGEDLASVNAVVSINMIHIAPWAATEGLFRGAGALLSFGDRLFLYGPFKRRGQTADSNLRFDVDLKRRDPAWGVRDLDDHVQPLGARFAFYLKEVVEMPANNLCVIFEKS
ncbi:MAG: DUF938 domain-containing protein [Pseudomonadota bacterium]